MVADEQLPLAVRCKASAIERTVNAVLTAGYALLLLVVHLRIVAVDWAYLGFAAIEPTVEIYLLTITAATWPAIFLPSRLSTLAAGVTWFLYLLTYVPLATVGLLTVGPVAPFVGLLLAAGVGLVLATAGAALPLPSVRLPADDSVKWAMLGTALVVLYGLAVLTFGVRPPSFSLSAVYEIRETYRAQASGLGRLGYYAVSWLGNVVNPVLLLVALRDRRLWPALAAVVGQVYLFGLTGQKSLPLMMVLVPLLWMGIGSVHRRLASATSVGLAGIVAGSVGIGLWTADPIWVSLFVRRLLSMPGLLGARYIEFFADKAPLMFSHSVLEHVFRYPYFEPYVAMLSKYVFGLDSGYANVGFLVDAWVNMGILGPVLVSVALGLYLAALRVIGGRVVQGRFGIVFAIIVCMALANSALNTALLNHGMLFAMLLVPWIPEGRR